MTRPGAETGHHQRSRLFTLTMAYSRSTAPNGELPKIRAKLSLICLRAASSGMQASTLSESGTTMLAPCLI